MEFPLRTILIDDEPLALQRLRRLLTDYESTFTIVSEARNGAEGLEMVEEHRPDVVFLDIEMPVLNGFEMLAKVSAMPLVVFATAYDQYAIQAFEENSIDYLLKPIEKDRLDKTVDKIRRRLGDGRLSDGKVPGSVNQDLLRLLEKMHSRREIHSLSVKSGDRILMVPLQEVSHFEAEDKYVFLSTLDGQKYLMTHTLTFLDEKLPPEFLRISRSAIINTRQINEIERYFNGKYLLHMRDRRASSLQSGSTYGDAIRSLLDI